MLKKLRNYLFLHVLYPMFHEGIDAFLNEYRYAQVNNIEVVNTRTYVTINKFFTKGTHVQFYVPYSPVEVDSELLQLEDIIAQGEVIRSNKELSIVLLSKQLKKLELGCFATAINLDHKCAFYSLMEL